MPHITLYEKRLDQEVPTFQSRKTAKAQPDFTDTARGNLYREY